MMSHKILILFVFLSIALSVVIRARERQSIAEIKFKTFQNYSDPNEIILEIDRIIYGSVGDQHNLIITPDSIHHYTDPNIGKVGYPDNKIKTKKSDWQRLLNSISKSNLMDYFHTESQHENISSTIIKVRTNKSEYTAMIDGNNPDARIVQLLSTIEDIVKDNQLEYIYPNR
jgi:hypothetical protein